MAAQPHDAPRKRLQIKILQGRNLAVKDITGARTGSKIRTKTIWKNLNPVWNEKYEFEIVSAEKAEVQIEVWDEDYLSSDDFMGQLVIPLSDVPLNTVVDKWYTLQKKKDKDKIKGDIHLSLQYYDAKATMKPEDFEVLSVLGKGTFGKVFQVKKKSNSKIYAMKVLKKAYIVKQQEVDHTLAERSILRSVNHPFMINLRYAFQTETKLYLVLDYVNGGELFFHLQRARRFDEARARFYTAEVVLVIEYLHSCGIIYRDLKPENLLVENTGHIRITDFGLSKEGLGQNDRTMTFCGTPAYLAPEVINQKPYGKEIDWWSLGNLVFEMMTGLPPFYVQGSNNVNDIYSKILSGNLTFPSYISPVAKDLMSSLLRMEPKDRLGYPDNAKAIKAHKFFEGINWELLVEKKVTPPFVPSVKDDKDISHFDPYFTKEAAADNEVAPPISPADNARFKDFDVMSSDGSGVALKGATTAGAAGSTAPPPILTASASAVGSSTNLQTSGSQEKKPPKLEVPQGSSQSVDKNSPKAGSSPTQGSSKKGLLGLF